MFLGKDHRVKASNCPFCEYQHDGATQINGNNLPKPGDVSICIKCGLVGVFDDNLDVRKPTAKEEAEFKKDDTITEAQKSILLSLILIERNRGKLH